MFKSVALTPSKFQLRVISEVLHNTGKPRTLLTLWFLLLSATISAQSLEENGVDATRKPIRIMAIYYEPWSYEEDGHYKGISAEIAPRFAKLSGFNNSEFFITDRTTPRLIEAAQTDEADIYFMPDVFFPVSKDAPFNRAHNCDTTLVRTSLIGVSLTKDSYKTDGLSFLMHPVSSPELHKKIVGNHHFETVSGPMSNMVKRLLAGRTDVVVGEATVIFWTARKLMSRAASMLNDDLSLKQALNEITGGKPLLLLGPETP